MFSTRSFLQFPFPPNAVFPFVRLPGNKSLSFENPSKSGTLLCKPRREWRAVVGVVVDHLLALLQVFEPRNLRASSVAQVDYEDFHGSRL